MKNSIKKIASIAMAAAIMSSTSAVMATPVSAAESQSATTSSASATKLNTTSMILTKGYKFNLELKNASGTVQFKSADSSIATVDSKGKVIGKSIGSTVIYAYDGVNTYSCNVQVVATKISAGSSNVNVNANASKKVKVTVKGNKHIKATIDDKDIATVSWAKKWDGDSIYLIVNGKKSGTASIKLYNPDYPNVYKTIKVKVGSGTTSTIEDEKTSPLSISYNSMTIDSGVVNTFRVNGKAERIAVESSDPNVLATAVSASRNGGYDVSVYGYQAGTAMVKVYDTKNPSNAVFMTVTVKSGVVVNPYVQYFVERTYNLVNPPSLEVKRESDKICYWVDSKTSQLTYMIVPYNYTPDYSYQYCIPVNRVVNTSPYYDGDDYMSWVLFGKNANYYTRRLYDICHPTNNVFTMTSTDKFVYTIKSNGDIEYIIVPYNFTYDYISAGYNILNADGSSYFVNANYYEVTTTPPRKKLSTDKVLNWQDYNLKPTYMLVPANYDKVRADTARAKYSGEYLYYTVYSSKPIKCESSDIIIDYWNEKAEDYRYILVPRNYNESRVDRLMEADIESTEISTAEENVNEVINAINEERKRSGISSLVVDDSLMKAAQVRVSELPEKFSHKRPDGSSYKTALDEAGVAYKYSDEMIFKNMKFASDVVVELFEDDDYRDSLLSSFNKKIGVAYNPEKNCYVVLITN